MVSINLVPIEIKEKIRQAKTTADQAGIALVVLIAFVVATILVYLVNGMFLQMSLNNVKNEINDSRAQLDSFSLLEKQASSINNRVQLASKVEEKKAKWSQIIQELVTSVPQSVQFVSFNASSEKTPNIVIQAKTDSERNIIIFKDKLESSNFFKNIAFKSSSSSLQGVENASNTKIVTFSLEFDLERLFDTANKKETK